MTNVVAAVTSAIIRYVAALAAGTASKSRQPMTGAMSTIVNSGKGAAIISFSYYLPSVTMRK
jgi:hypothetical protein